MVQNEIMIVECYGCGKEIHPKRLEILPNTKHCVKCSDTNRKRGVTIQQGKGDHSYTDIVILEEKQYREYMNLEARAPKKSNKSELLDSGDGDTQVKNLGEINRDIA